MRSHEYPMPEHWFEMMVRINAEVNLLPYKVEPSNQDIWCRMSDGNFADCANFAVEKAERLTAAGLPIQRLRLATCWIGADGGRKQGQGHAVLVVDGPQDQYILSNGREPLTYQQFWATQWMRDRIQVIGGQQEWTTWDKS